MAVKCSITTRVLDKIKAGTWGFAKDYKLDLSILGNYVESLACNGLLLKPCGETDDLPCGSSATIVNCNINLVGISFTNNTTDGSFFLATGDVYGAKQPLTYKWTVDTSRFDIVGATDQPSIKVKAKAGKSLDGIVAPISLEITDANGCKDTKQCYYTPSGMKCNNSFVPCYPVDSLAVSYLYVQCFKAQNLVVTKL